MHGNVYKKPPPRYWQKKASARKGAEAKGLFRFYLN